MNDQRSDQPAGGDAAASRAPGEDGTAPWTGRPGSGHPAQRVLLAWELGGGLGHIANLLAIGRRLAAHGHQVTLACADLAQTHLVMSGGNTAITLVQAPVWLPQTLGLPDPPLTYAEVLMRVGYLDGAMLSGLVRGWRGLFAQWRPDLLLADHSPTALLAARGLPMLRCVIGSGFTIPPPITPLPSYCDWESVSTQRLQEGERVVIQAADVALRLAVPSATPPKSVADWFSADESFLMSWPDLDVYRRPAETRYWGPGTEATQGTPVQWPAGDGPRVLAYLRPEASQTLATLEGLRRLGTRMVAFVPRLPAASRTTLASDRLLFVDAPAHLASACEQASLVVCHGGAGVTAASLQAATPMLLLPMHMEQLTSARRLAALGVATVVPPSLQETALSDWVANAASTLLTDEAVRSSARAASHRISALANDALLDAIAVRCDELMRGRR